ncbi:MAG: twin-arginine translocase TatA/TatE family subunit [Pseudomonadota bacterium]
MFSNIGLPGIIIIGLLIVLLFGRGKISQVMGDVAKGINAFKKGMKEGVDDESKKVEGEGPTIDATATTTTTASSSSAPERERSQS